MNIKNLSQLKKTLQIGATIKVVNHHRTDWVGQIRKVLKVQTNGIYLSIPNHPENENGSWMEFMKANNYEFGETVKYKDNLGILVMEFVVLD